MAPERMEDEDILNLIKKFDGGCAAITAAIENIWHGKQHLLGDEARRSSDFLL